MSNPAAKAPANVSGATPLEKARMARKKKVPSPVRAAAEKAYKEAKSDQEKTIARGHVKIIRFKEIVVPRVNKALKILAQVEKLANRNAYTWTPEEAAKVTAALAKVVQRIAHKFEGAKTEKDSFAL